MSPGDVLIVDDDDDMLEVVELLLQQLGYDTATASNGEEALEMCERAMPSLILLDMLMPVMDGWHFAREFRARYGGAVPIVVLTAAEHAQSRCVGLDITDVLAKPFEIADLLQIVDHHVDPPLHPHRAG